LDALSRTLASKESRAEEPLRNAPKISPYIEDSNQEFTTKTIGVQDYFGKVGTIARVLSFFFAPSMENKKHNQQKGASRRFAVRKSP
jgi:hypothetical protein